MTRQQAEKIAEILRGEERGDQRDEEGWIVLFERPDGRLVALSDESVDEYSDQGAFQEGHCYATIGFRSP